MMNMSHWGILRKLEGSKDRKGYIKILTDNQMVVSDYFIKSSYIDGSGKENTCYKLTKMGCEFLANKFTGEKGVLFTAKYVEHFNEMEKRLTKPKSELDVLRQAIDQIELAQREAKEAKEIAKTTSKNMEQLNNIVNVENQTTLRQQFNESVRALAYDRSWPISDTYNKIYKIINNNKHINLKLRARNVGKKPIDILERDNLLEYSLRVVNNHFN